jgi:hypothetical protein
LQTYLQDADATILHYGGDGWSRTNSARGGGFTVHWGYQFSYISINLVVDRGIEPLLPT